MVLLFFIDKTGGNVKNFISKLFLLLGIICVVGCSNISLDNSKTTENSNTEVGTLIINKNANRALDVAAIEYAKVTIIGSDISYEISKMSDKVLNGKGSFEIQGIPVGNNRVVVVDAYANSDERMNGITITAVTDIVPGDNVLDEINWETSKLGNVYKALIEAKVKTNDFTADDEAVVAAVIPSVNHAMLIDTVSIAEDFRNDALKTSSDYKLSTSKVNIVARYAKGYSFYVDDPISSKSEANPLKITTDDASNKTYSIDDVAPGLWTLHITDPDEKVSTKVISVDGSGSTVSGGVYAGQEKIDGYRVHFYGASWSSYYLYYYSSDESKNGAAWPGKKLTKSADGNTYYIDLTDSWVAGGDTLCIFAESSSPGNNRYPADMQPGVVLPSGVNQAWFNFATKQFVTTSPFSTDPVVSVSPSGDVQFSGTNTSVTIRADYCTTAKYTIDGSDPKAFGTEFTSSKVITIGDTCKIGDVVKVRVWGTDGNLESSTSATYKKVDKPSTPTRLGAYYTKTATSFSIWSPDSSNVKVVVTPKGGSAKEYTCTSGFQVDGNYPDSSKIYGVTVSGDLHLAEYQFKINGTNVRDPYGVMIKYDGNQQKTNQLSSGKENGFNYTSYAGPSANIVIDLDQTDPEGGWAERPKLDNRNDAIVYEVHVGDFTSDATWGGTAKNAGKFPGMVETGTKYGSVSTGIDHLKELGVTHVQLLPFYDYATKNNTSLSDIYNWGYDPVNYNVPEDRFSTCPSDYVERIREVKEMINEFHKNGIRVIMDVVYNHTYDKEMFKNISTKYYTTTDLSGCGNSINTGVPMVSRMIRDSLEYWVDEYNIDGFRFDLIGIYHTSAVKDWGNYMNNTKFPDRMLLMYGEPWNGYATDNEESQKVRMSAVSSLTSAKVGVFNGKYRQSLKGSNDTGKRGYIFNQNEDDGTAYAANIAVGLKGSLTSLDKSSCSDISGTWTRFFAGTPDQSINYISAHDNLCLWDKIKEAGVTGDYAQRIVKFGHGILLTSQGIPFIHAGDEFLRTKHKGKGSSMAHNSYMAGIETNSIDWKLKSTNNGIFKYHADLFKLRKDNDGLRYRKGTGSTTISGNAVNYYVQNTNGTKLCIVVNPGNNMSAPVSGTKIFDIYGATPKSSTCEGTAVTVIKY